MQNTLYLALGFFVLAIFFGFIVFVQLLSERQSFKPAVYLHGIVAMLGLSCLGLYTYQHVGSKPWVGLSILILAALGGFAMFSFDIRKKPVPKVILLLHPLAALVGLGLLVYYLIY